METTAFQRRALLGAFSNKKGWSFSRTFSGLSVSFILVLAEADSGCLNCAKCNSLARPLPRGAEEATTCCHYLVTHRARQSLPCNLQAFGQRAANGNGGLGREREKERDCLLGYKVII